MIIYKLLLSDEDIICNHNQQIRKDRNCIRFVISPETDFKECVRNFFGINFHSFSRYKINYWSAVFSFRHVFKCKINNILQNRSAHVISITNISDTFPYVYVI